MLTSWRFYAGIAFLDRLAWGCAAHPGAWAGAAGIGTPRPVVRGSQFQRVDRVLRAGMYADRTGPQEDDRRNGAGQTGPAFLQRTITGTGRRDGARTIPGHRRGGA